MEEKNEWRDERKERDDGISDPLKENDQMGRKGDENKMRKRLK